MRESGREGEANIWSCKVSFVWLSVTFQKSWLYVASSYYICEDISDETIDNTLTCKLCKADVRHSWLSLNSWFSPLNHILSFASAFGFLLLKCVCVITILCDLQGVDTIFIIMFIIMSKICKIRYIEGKVSLWLLSAWCGVWHSVIMADILMLETLFDYELLKVVVEL